MPRSGLFPRCLRVLPLALVALAALTAPDYAQNAPSAGDGSQTAQEAAQAKGQVTGLPIPRFVSLRADTVNLRTGPGLRYPIDWVYKRRDMPVLIVDEFDAWRQIRDWEGTLGWVHSVMLQGKRTARVVGGEPTILREHGHQRGNPVALVPSGVIGTLERCEWNWCLLDFGEHAGWLRRDRLYGAD